MTGAQKVAAMYANERLINQYYRQYNKRRKKFYLYKKHIYAYELLGFMSIDNEIQLMRLEMPDILELLNQSNQSMFRRLQRWIRG